MKIDKTSWTAQYIAFPRALEAKRRTGDKLFSDHLLFIFRYQA